MHNGRYLFGFFFFFVFLTILLILAAPNGPGNSRIGSYYTKPNSAIHYSQVPDGTNMTACITIDNTPFTAFDLINYSFRVTVSIDLGGSEYTLVVKEMKLFVYRNDVMTIRVNFTASKHGYTDFVGIFIFVDWGVYVYTENLRMAELQIGDIEEQQEELFTFSNTMIWISAISMVFLLFFIGITARLDFQAYRKGKKPPPIAAPTTAPIPTSPPPQEPPIRAPVSVIPSSPIPPAPEQRHVETMILIPCPACGTKIDKSQTVCPSCGHEFQKCVVCNLIIEEDEQTEACPECGALAHRDHFREWVHINGKCPICKKSLTF